MSQNNANDKAAAMEMIAKLNAVEGFDPAPFAVDYTDLNEGETRKRLPVMIQMAWFRLKYPEGKIALLVTPGNGCFVATARVYMSYKDAPENFLAEATASRSPMADKPSVSPREWAQTAAIGIALRNAGFGLQFAMAGDDFPENAVDELMPSMETTEAPQEYEAEPPATVPAAETPRELTMEEKYEQAVQAPCPISKFKGKTLGEVLVMDPKALKWVATKFTGDPEIKAAAEVICEYALQQAS